MVSTASSSLEMKLLSPSWMDTTAAPDPLIALVRNASPDVPDGRAFALTSTGIPLKATVFTTAGGPIPFSAIPNAAPPCCGAPAGMLRDAVADAPAV